jgi:hypothetical protein
MLRRIAAHLTIVALYGLAGCATSPSGTSLHYFNGLITTGYGGSIFEENPKTTIQRKDNIYFVNHVRWEPATAVGGSHVVNWKWYSSNGTLVATRELKLNFDKTPYRFYWHLPAGDLDLGHYRVDVAVDGAVIDTREFDIVS